MRTKKGFCKFCQKETNHRCIVTAHINGKIYFVANCDVCNRGAFDCYKATSNQFKSDTVKIEQCEII